MLLLLFYVRYFTCTDCVGLVDHALKENGLKYGIIIYDIPGIPTCGLIDGLQ